MMTGKVLVDTNVVSYTMRGKREAEAYERHLSNRLLLISFITVGELYYGAEKGRWGQSQMNRLDEHLRNFLVVPYDYRIARLYGSARAGRQRSGRPISSSDAWIAACALRHEIPLVTHNARDFEGIPGLALITEVLPR